MHIARISAQTAGILWGGDPRRPISLWTIEDRLADLAAILERATAVNPRVVDDLDRIAGDLLNACADLRVCDREEREFDADADAISQENDARRKAA